MAVTGGAESPPSTAEQLKELVTRNKVLSEQNIQLHKQVAELRHQVEDLRTSISDLVNNMSARDRALVVLRNANRVFAEPTEWLTDLEILELLDKLLNEQDLVVDLLVEVHPFGLYSHNKDKLYSQYFSESS